MYWNEVVGCWVSVCFVFKGSANFFSGVTIAYYIHAYNI